MIIYPPAFVLSEAAAGRPLTRPRIGWSTYTFDLLPSAVTASTEDADFPKDAPLRPDTAEAWSPTALPATWEIDLGATRAVDYIGIAGHTLGSSGVSVIAETGALPTPSFSLLLADLGAGEVDLTLLRGTGSATFTRATTAWCKLASGLWAEVTSGTPRAHYIGANTAVGAYGGYLAEGARTNRCLQARDLTNASWTKTTATAAKTQVGIDGVTNSASSLTATAGNATALQAITSASVERIYSAFVKRLTGNDVIEMTMDNGGTWTAITSLINSTNYTQVSVPSATTTNPTVGFRIVTNGDAIAVDMCQEETGAFASTPIPTTTVSVTRNADVLTFPYSGNADATAGTAYAELSTEWAVAESSAVAIGFSSGMTGSPMGAASAGLDTAVLMNDVTNQATKSGLSSMRTGVRKRASSWGASGLSITGDGAAPATAAFDGSMDSSAIGIGAGTSGANQWNGGIQNVHLWTTQVTNAQLQAITPASDYVFDPPWQLFSVASPPTDDTPIMLLDTSRSTTRVRLTFIGGSVMPRIAVIYVGEVLAMEREIEAPYTPLNLSRQTVLHRSLSRGGQFLGQGFRRHGVTGSARFQYLSPDFYRNEFDPFVEHARSLPYFFGWDPLDYPEEVAYVWTDKDIAPSYMGTKDVDGVNWMTVGWNMSGIGTV